MEHVCRIRSWPRLVLHNFLYAPWWRSKARARSLVSGQKTWNWNYTIIIHTFHCLHSPWNKRHPCLYVFRNIENQFHVVLYLPPVRSQATATFRLCLSVFVLKLFSISPCCLYEVVSAYPSHYSFNSFAVMAQKQPLLCLDPEFRGWLSLRPSPTFLHCNTALSSTEVTLKNYKMQLKNSHSIHLIMF